MRRIFHLIILFTCLSSAAYAQEETVPAAPEAPTQLSEFDQRREKLRADYMALKKEIEDDYALMINAINPGPTDLELQIKKRDLERELRERKQLILDDYQEQLIIIRDEEAEQKGLLDMYYYSEPEPPPAPVIPRAEKKKEPAKKKVEKRGSRTIPPYSGKSAIGTKPKYKSRGRAGGLVKGRRSKKAQDAEDDDDNKKSGTTTRNGIGIRKMFDKRR